MANGNRFTGGFDPGGMLSTVLQLRGFQEQQRRQQLNDRMREQNLAMQQLGFVTNLGAQGIDLQKEAPTLAQRFPLEVREIGSVQAKLAKQQQAAAKEKERQGEVNERIPRIAQQVAEAPGDRATSTAQIQPFAGDPESLNRLAGEIRLAQAEVRKRQRDPATLTERLVAEAEQVGIENMSPLRRLLLEKQLAGNGLMLEFNEDGTLRSIRQGNLGGLTAIQKQDLVQEAQQIRISREMIRDMAETIQRDPSRITGVASRLQNNIDRGLGLIESFDAVFGPGFGDAVRDLGQRAFERSARQDPRVQSRFGKFFTAGADIAELEVDRTILAFALADINRGSGRLPVRFVDDFRKLLDFQDARGARSVLQRLRRLDTSLLARRERDIKERARLGNIDLPESLFEPLEDPRGTPRTPGQPRQRPRERRFRPGEGGFTEGAP